MIVSISPRSWFTPHPSTPVQRFKVTLAPLTILALVVSCVTPSLAAPPANDFFGAATTISVGALPFSDVVDVTEATQESGEPFGCTFSFQTIWYRLTPATTTWLRASTSASSLSGTTVNIYRDSGSGIFGLSFITCSPYNGSGTFLAQGGTTYYLQAQAPCCGVLGDVRLDVVQTSAPVPIANFYFYPSDPSVYDLVHFSDQSFDPGQQGFQSFAWNLGDGTTAAGCCPNHGYAADGDYTVLLQATTTDGRSDTTIRTVNVRTHDVAITKFKTPTSASAGQSRQITVGIRNTRYPETVHVQLEKSLPGSFNTFQFVGSLNLAVPVRSANRTTDFAFSYTFTSDDARVGKVTFRAEADVATGHDALMADNVAISLPVKVSGSGTPLVEATGGAQVAAGDLVSDGESLESSPVAQLALLGVTPNPANRGANLLVRLALPVPGIAKLEVVDVAGRVMTKSDLSTLGPGVHETRVQWERRPAPGIYWVRLTQGDHYVSKPVSLLE